MNRLIFRKANINDSKKYFEWVNDSYVREHSYNSNKITWQQHEKWFNEKIADPNFTFYIFQNLENNYIGQVRLQKIDMNNYLIGISVAAEYRGLGLGPILLKMACNEFLNSCFEIIIHAYIKENNLASKIIFEKAGFKLLEKLYYENFYSSHFILCK